MKQKNFFKLMLVLTLPLLLNSLWATHAVVHYWDVKNMGFGHVSISIYKNKGDRPIYLSFATFTSYNNDVRLYEKEPKHYALYELPLENYDQFVRWYRLSKYVSSDGYDILERNCAHFVYEALKHLGYPVKKPHFKLLGVLRPIHVKSMAKKFEVKKEAKSDWKEYRENTHTF